MFKVGEKVKARLAHNQYVFGTITNINHRQYTLTIDRVFSSVTYLQRALQNYVGKDITVDQVCLCVTNAPVV